LTFDRTCSGDVAPAMTEATAGWLASQEKASSRRVWRAGGELGELLRDLHVLLVRSAAMPLPRNRGLGLGAPLTVFGRQKTVARGKKGRKASFRRSHSGRTSASGSRWRRLYWF